MTLTPEVSVVLPVHNGERYLASAIESVLCQTNPDWELIIVDDCSIDASNEIAQRYTSDRRVSLLKNESNLGLPASLNVGFEKAKGMYFSWTSHDNLYRPPAIEKLLSALKQNTDAVLAASNYSTIDDNGNEIAPVKLDLPFRQLIYTNNVGACFLYRSSAANQTAGYSARFALAEDYEYWLRLIQLGDFVHVEDDLYLYRIHRESLTAKREAAIRAADARAKVEHINLLRGCSPKVAARTYSQISRNHPEPALRFKYRFRYLAKKVVPL